jgi:hypothetical protein
MKSKCELNVPGVIFDWKFMWSNHVNNVIMKANRALNAIKLIFYEPGR